MPPTVVIGRGIAAEATVKFVQRGGSRGLLRGGAVEHESGKRGVPVSIARARDQFRLYSRVNKRLARASWMKLAMSPMLTCVSTRPDCSMNR